LRKPGSWEILNALWGYITYETDEHLSRRRDDVDPRRKTSEKYVKKREHSESANRKPPRGGFVQFRSPDRDDFFDLIGTFFSEDTFMTNLNESMVSSFYVKLLIDRKRKKRGGKLNDSFVLVLTALLLPGLCGHWPPRAVFDGGSRGLTSARGS